MKISGAALVLIGLVVGTYVGINAMLDGAADRTALVIMTAVAAGSALAGGVALAFGGRGFIVSNNPSVHN
jgi:hypothetical protein